MTLSTRISPRQERMFWRIGEERTSLELGMWRRQWVELADALEDAAATIRMRGETDHAGRVAARLEEFLKYIDDRLTRRDEQLSRESRSPTASSETNQK